MILQESFCGRAQEFAFSPSGPCDLVRGSQTDLWEAPQNISSGGALCPVLSDLGFRSEEGREVWVPLAARKSARKHMPWFKCGGIIKISCHVGPTVV